MEYHIWIRNDTTGDDIAEENGNGDITVDFSKYSIQPSLNGYDIIVAEVGIYDSAVADDGILYLMCSIVGPNNRDNLGDGNLNSSILCILPVLNDETNNVGAVFTSSQTRTFTSQRIQERVRFQVRAMADDSQVDTALFLLHLVIRPRK